MVFLNGVSVLSDFTCIGSMTLDSFADEFVNSFTREMNNNEDGSANSCINPRNHLTGGINTPCRSAQRYDIFCRISHKGYKFLALIFASPNQNKLTQE